MNAEPRVVIIGGGIAGLAAGVYFLRFDYGSGRMTRKVLVE